MFSKQPGLALVVVLWILSLLTIMAGSFALSMRRESAVTASIKDNAQAAALAESGINLAQLMMLWPDKDRRWRAGARVYRLLTDEHELRVRIFAETGKVDLNMAAESLLLTVMRAVTEDSQRQRRLVDAIIDWRDADDQPRPQGAERDQYAKAGVDVVPANGPFQTLDELQQLLGMDNDLYQKLLPWLTVYSGQAEVDLQQATPDLLQLLQTDLSNQRQSNTFLDQRLEAGDSQSAAIPGNAETTLSGIYTILAQVRGLDGGKASLQVIVRNGDEGNGALKTPFTVLDWRRFDADHSLFDEDRDTYLINIDNEFTERY